jgi:hypothetical protein
VGGDGDVVERRSGFAGLGLLGGGRGLGAARVHGTLYLGCGGAAQPGSGAPSYALQLSRVLPGTSGVCSPLPTTVPS